MGCSVIWEETTANQKVKGVDIESAPVADAKKVAPTPSGSPGSLGEGGEWG